MKEDFKYQMTEAQIKNIQKNPINRSQVKATLDKYVANAAVNLQFALGSDIATLPY